MLRTLAVAAAAIVLAGVAAAETRVVEVAGDGTLEVYQVETADGEVLCPHPSVEHTEPFTGSGRAPDAIGWIWCRWAGGDYVDDPTDDVTATGEGRLVGYAVLVADSDILELACFDPVVRGLSIVCDRLRAEPFFAHVRREQEKGLDLEGAYSSPFAERSPEALAAAKPVAVQLEEGLDGPLPPRFPVCEIGDALLRAERTANDATIVETAFEGTTYSVTDYGEDVRIRYNALGGDHRTVGIRVAQLTSFGRTVFVARAFNAGTPAVIDISFDRLSDIRGAVEWLREGTPLLRDDRGYPIREGAPVYSVKTGPLAGFDLVLAGCQS